MLLSDDACDDSFREAFGIMVTVDGEFGNTYITSSASS